MIVFWKFKHSGALADSDSVVKHFCDSCSNYRVPCPERGWDPGEPVRVCKPCYDLKTTSNHIRLSSQSPRRDTQETIQARRSVFLL